MKTALVIRHVPFEGLAGFAQPIEAAGYRIVRHDMPALPLDHQIHVADLVVAMGGPMGVYDTGAYPWIGQEVRVLAERIAAGGPTLGICLGAQMIAAALGARVFPGPTKEVGFAPVMLTDAGASSPLRHLTGVPILHWHGDTFDLPDGVQHLAVTEIYAHQAFRRGNRLLALQCHPEMGEDARFEQWLDGSDAYLAEAGTDAMALRDEYRRNGPPAAAAGRAMLRDWLAELDC